MMFDMPGCSGNHIVEVYSLIGNIYTGEVMQSNIYLREKPPSIFVCTIRFVIFENFHMFQFINFTWLIEQNGS